MLPPFLEETASGVRLHLKVQPGAKKNSLGPPLGEALKIRIQAPPLDGKANETLVEYLQTLLKIPRKNFKILSGARSRLKVVEIQGITAKDCLTRVLSPH